MTKVREPTSIIDMVEMCRIANQRIADTKTVEPKVRDMAVAVLDILSVADFYELDRGLADAADSVFDQSFAGKRAQDIVFDLDSRLPSKVCVFWCKGTSTKFVGVDEALPFMYLAAHEDDNRIHVYMVSPYFGCTHQGGYAPATEDALVGPSDVSEEDKLTHAMHVLTVAAICSLLNQPSFTKREPAGSRQERRAAQRSGGYASDAWHKITWNIGEEVEAKLRRDEPVRCMPLHYTRGHWRRAEEGWKNTTLRKDGLWYQWIEGFWSGHPAFGIKKSYHAPKIGDAA